MPAWLTHFTTLAARIDAAIENTPAPADDMPSEVLVALIDGNLTPVEDQLEDLPALGHLRANCTRAICADPAKAPSR